MQLQLFMNIIAMACGFLTVRETRNQIGFLSELDQDKIAEYQRTEALYFHEVVLNATTIAAEIQDLPLSESIRGYLASSSYQNAARLPGAMFPMEQLYEKGNEVWLSNHCRIGGPVLKGLLSLKDNPYHASLLFMSTNYESAVPSMIFELHSPIGVQILEQIVNNKDACVVKAQWIELLAYIFQSAAAGGLAITRDALIQLIQKSDQFGILLP